MLDGLRNQTPPSLILNEENRTTTIIRDLLNGSFSSIYVDDHTVYEEIREYIRMIAPDKEKIVKLYKGSTPIFDNFDVSKQIMSLFSKYVSLKKGAYLIIEHTEALHVVDVNSGQPGESRQRSGAHGDGREPGRRGRNRASAPAARYGRHHRDRLHRPAQEREPQRAGREDARADGRRPRETHDPPLSKFGLMQITRQRVRPETHIDVRETCPACHGTGLVAPAVLIDDQIEKQIAYFVKEKKLSYLKLRVSPVVAAFVKKGFPSLRTRWMFKYRCRIRVASDNTTGIIETRFFNREDEELI